MAKGIYLKSPQSFQSERSTPFLPPSDPFNGTLKHPHAKSKFLAVTKGAAHFALLCASCHQTGTDTPSVGPDRLTFRSSGDASILTNLIDPNREVAPQYLAYNVTLNSGGSQIGLITSESPTHLTLRQPLGVELQLPRSDITSVQALGTSLMPENLDAALSPQALADLIAYLTRG